MVTQELLNYIHGQLRIGTPKEKIIQDLSVGGGWDLKNIEEAFQLITSQENTSIAPGSPLPGGSEVPSSIRYFEWLMYGSFLVDAFVVLLQLIAMVQPTYPSTLFGFGVSVCIKCICVYYIVYKQSNGAKIILIILLALSFFSVPAALYFASQITSLTDQTPLLSLAPITLQIAALYFLFRTSSLTWFTHSNSVGSGNSTHTEINKYWSSYVILTNKIFMGVSLIIMFGINVYILATDALGLGDDALFFYGIMFVPLILFAGFYLYENKNLSARFMGSQSNIDPWILALILIRNGVFVLNFIPFIQIMGGIALIMGGVPYLIVYFLLLYMRKKSVTSAS